MNEEQNENSQNSYDKPIEPRTPPKETEIQTPPPTNNGGNKPVGAVIGIVIIIVVLAIGGLYFWGSRLNKLTPTQYLPDYSASEQMTSTDAQTESLEQIGSDDIDSIYRDLEETDLSDLDRELRDIEMEF